MGILAWIVLGAVAGCIANVAMGTRAGLIRMVLLGIAGALVGGFAAGNLLGVADLTGVNHESIVVAAIGAVFVVAIGQTLSGSGRSANRPV